MALATLFPVPDWGYLCREKGWFGDEKRHFAIIFVEHAFCITANHLAKLLSWRPLAGDLFNWEDLTQGQKPSAPRKRNNNKQETEVLS